MTHVLVTGGAGFIGSHLADRLSEEGFRVRILDNLASGNREYVPAGAEFLEGDIACLDTCHTAMEGISAVFHCAAMSRAAPSVTDCETCTRVNILGTQNVLIAARDAGVSKVIYSGSSTFYGSQPVPHCETVTEGDFLNAYALSKYVGEQYCMLFDRSYDLPCVILRYFNVYGPRQPREGAYALVMGIFLERARRGEALEIHGDGAQARDFVHVSDVVSANLAALRSDARHVVFNIGSGQNITVRALADMISPNQVFTPRRAGDAEATLADISRAKARLGWHPVVSPEEGIRALLHSKRSSASPDISTGRA